MMRMKIENPLPGTDVLVSLLQPDLVCLAAVIGDEGVEVAIAVQIAQGDTVAETDSLGLAAVSERARAIVGPDLVCFFWAFIGDEGVEVAVAVKVAQRDTAARRASEGLVGLLS